AIPVRQYPLADRHAVDVRAVRAPEIAKREGAAGRLQCAVAARHQMIRNVELAAGVAPDRRGVAVDDECFAAAWSGENDELRRHRTGIYASKMTAELFSS